MTTAPTPLAVGAPAVPPNPAAAPMAGVGQGHAFAGLLVQLSHAMSRHPNLDGAAGAAQSAGTADDTAAPGRVPLQQGDQAPGDDHSGTVADTAAPAVSAFPGTQAALAPNALAPELASVPQGASTTPLKDPPKAITAAKLVRRDAPPPAGQGTPPAAAAAAPVSVPTPSAAPMADPSPNSAPAPQRALHDAMPSAALRSLPGTPEPTDITPAAPTILGSGPAAPPLTFGADAPPPGAVEPPARSVNDTLASSFADPAAATTAASTTAAGKSGGAPALAPQLAPVLVQLSHQAGGVQVTLQLNPLELGKVQIQIDRGADGTAAVHVSAERPETLQLLVADQAHLHRALDAAGIPLDGRTLNLSLSTPDQGGGNQASGGTGQGGSNNQAGGQTGQHNRNRYGLGVGPETAMDGGGTASWLRAGVDITA